MVAMVIILKVKNKFCVLTNEAMYLGTDRYDCQITTAQYFILCSHGMDSTIASAVQR